MYIPVVGLISNLANSDLIVLNGIFIVRRLYLDFTGHDISAHSGFGVRSWLADGNFIGRIGDQMFKIKLKVSYHNQFLLR